MQELGVGIVGIGHAGREHFKAFDENPDAEVRAAWAPSVRRLDVFPGSMDLLAPTYESMLDRDDIHIISLCSPNYAHADQAVAALEAGKHVICEKPLATTLEDCERIVRMADTKPSLKFMVGQSARFNPICKAIKRMYDEGELGEAFYAEADYLHNIGNRIKDWWIDDRNPHFGLMGGGVHPIDLLRWIVGDIEEVFAISNHKVLAEFPHDDAYLMNFRFENGCMGKMAAFLGCQRPYEMNLAIYGTRGTAINDRLYLSKVEELEDFIRLPITILAEHPTFGEEMAHFVDCILNDGTPLVDVRDGAKSAATCIAGAESIETGKPVRVKNSF